MIGIGDLIGRAETLAKGASALTWIGWALGIGAACAAAGALWLGAHDGNVARRAETKAEAVCEAARVSQALAAERAKAEALRRAGMEKDRELALRAEQAQTSAASVATLEKERGELRDKVKTLESARRIALPFDAWMRERARTAAAPAAGR